MLLLIYSFKHYLYSISITKGIKKTFPHNGFYCILSVGIAALHQKILLVYAFQNVTISYDNIKYNIF